METDTRSRQHPHVEVASISMAVVPWTYNNPRVDRRVQRTQNFRIAGETLKILQETTAEINVNQNTGLKLWDGAYLLARYLQDKADFPVGFWKDKRCVEIGAGCGLVGMAAWLRGAHVVLTDIDGVLQHTNKCLEMNKERLKGGTCEVGTIKTEALWWGTDCKHLDPPCDVILGSDVIYQKDYVKNLLGSLRELSNKDTVIYLTYKPRGLGEEVFFDELGDYSFRCEMVSSKKHPIEFQGTDYQILKLYLVDGH